MNQKPEIRQVLVFENVDTPGMQVAAELRKFASPMSICVITTSDLPAVRQILKTQAIAAVVIEVGRETGDALAALRLLGKGDQAIPLYVYNGFMLPRIEEKSLEYGHVQYFEDHLNFDHFVAMILDELSKKRRGIIHGIALASFLKLMNNEKFNGQIIVTTSEKKGILSLCNGQLVCANMNGSKSNTALAEMSSWEKVTVEIKEEQPAGANGSGRTLKAEPLSKKALSAAVVNHEAGSGHIDIMCFTHQGEKIAVNIKKLNSALLEVQGLLADMLLKMDIFLSADGRTLAGWNSHPLACSIFAAITRSALVSLKASGFPQLQNYYLFDLGDEHTVLVILQGGLQWGMLLKGGKKHMGLLLNIVMPKAVKALAGCLQNVDAV